MWGKFKDGMSELGFYTALELERSNLAKQLKAWLSGYTIDDFQKMIIRGEMPEIDANVFRTAAPYAKYMNKITVFDLMEVLGEASPAVFQLIQGNGEAGANYLVKLRKHFIDSCTKQATEAVSPEMKRLVCDSCKKAWIVEKTKVAEVTECPFCHAPAK